MDRPELLERCYEVYPDHPMLKLFECRSIVSKGVETDREAALLEEVMGQLRLNPVFGQRIMRGRELL